MPGMLPYHVIMQWDVILEAYPGDRSQIERARDVHDRMHMHLAVMPLPEIVPGSVVSEPSVDVVAELIRRSAPEAARDLGDAEVSALVYDCLAGRELPEKKSLLVNAAVQLCFHALHSHCADGIPEHWTRGSCPFCGAEAVLGLDDDNGRRLGCARCGHLWAFRRLCCPACGNDDHLTLGYFEAESWSGVRVYFCESCRHALRVFDTRVRPVHDVATAHILTAPLCELALQEGFSPAGAG